jgi:hypothetical protein
MWAFNNLVSGEEVSCRQWRKLPKTDMVRNYIAKLNSGEGHTAPPQPPLFPEDAIAESTIHQETLLTMPPLLAMVI